jgi:hypothetical protein
MVYVWSPRSPQQRLGAQNPAVKHAVPRRVAGTLRVLLVREQTGACLTVLVHRPLEATRAVNGSNLTFLFCDIRCLRPFHR